MGFESASQDVCTYFEKKTDIPVIIATW